MNSSPSQLLRRKIGYKIIQKLTNDTSTGFTVTLNPVSFEYSGMCKLHLRSISLRAFTAGNELLGVEVNTTQPFSQSNIHGTTAGGAPSWNPANEVYWSQISSTATSHNDTDLVASYIFTTISPATTFTIRLHNGNGTEYAGSFTGVLIWEIIPVEL